MYVPNRIIKESIHESEKINNLTDFQFRLWIYLIVYVDDYGRGDARPAIIKGNCFPLRDRVTVTDIDAGLHALADAGVVVLYNVGGKPLLYLPSWGKHQRIQQKRSKYPSPEESDDFTCSQKSTVNHRESPPESESESESESKSEAGSACARVNRPLPQEEMTASAYCEMCLRGMSPGNYDELRSFLDEGLPDDLVRFAVDDACGHGFRSWSYVSKILNRYVVQGIKTVDQARAEKKAHDSKGQGKGDSSELPAAAESWGGAL